MLKIMSKAVALALLIAQVNVFAAIRTATQTPSDKQQPNQDKPLKLRTEEVIVDAVVLDKKNHWVTDLTADDFEVYEDGVKQRITSFRFEANAAASQSSPVAKNDSSNIAHRSFNLVTLVFDAQTTRDGALRARKAAFDYIENGMGPNDYVAVFGVDLNLLLLSPYTNDKAGIREAVEAFTSRESKKYTAVAAEARSKLEGMVEPLSDAKRIALADSLTGSDVIPPPAPSETRDVRDDSVVMDPAQALKTAIYLSGLRVLRTFERYEREFQGHRSVDALLAIINGQKEVRAGRKVMMYFSEGFAVTPAVSEQFKSVISAANTTGVTIYAFDIAGLRLESPNAQTMLERNAASQTRMRNANPELVQGGVSALGRSEEVARINTVTTLDELSEDTGGYTIKNTNDIAEGLKRILDELDNHYVITYISTNPDYSGKFRRIAVKLSRAGEYKIRARRGYYALRTLDDSPVMAHEAPLLERVNSETITSDFPMHAQAHQFRGTNAARLLAIYVEFPVAALKFDTDDKAKTFSSRFAILALVKNNSGEIVRKLGQQFTLRGPLAQMADVRTKPQIYNRMILLAPGKYTLDAVVRDTSTGKAAVVRTPFEVPGASEDDLSVSSVVLSRGVNPLTEEQKKQSAHPLYLEGQAYFVPNVEQTFSLARDKNILVHFNVYTPKSARSKVNATVAFLKGGSVFTQAGGALPDPDAAGKIAYATSFPTEHFQPGEYDLRITVTDGSRRAASTAHFKIEP